MAAYTAQQQQEIVERYRPAILKQVRRYRSKRFPMISHEDLFQEGVEAILLYLRKQDTEQPFIFPTFDVQAHMLRSLHSGLPLSYGHTKKFYLQRVREAPPATGLQEELTGYGNEIEDVDFRIDFSRFYESLSEKARNLIDLVLDGNSWEEAAQKMGLSRSGGYYLRTQIKEKYDNMMR